MSTSLFISYRRNDAAPVARGLRERLRVRFGPSRVFMDEDSIPAGQRWPQRIEGAVSDAKVMLVLIGPKWLTAADGYGRRRLDDPEDWVRREIVRALELDIGVVPLLVAGQVDMPPEEALPDVLKGLAQKQRVILHDDSWDANLAALSATLGEEYGIVDVQNPTPSLPKATGQKGGVPQLNEAQIDAQLVQLDGWEPVEDTIPGSYPPRSRQELRKSYTFDSFEHAVQFMLSAVPYIDKMKHHPRWQNQYKTVIVWYSTWAIGQRISDWDIKAARALDKHYQAFLERAASHVD